MPSSLAFSIDGLQPLPVFEFGHEGIWEERFCAAYASLAAEESEHCEWLPRLGHALSRICGKQDPREVARICVAAAAKVGAALSD